MDDADPKEHPRDAVRSGLHVDEHRCLCFFTHTFWDSAARRFAAVYSQ
jgi:hypothetical protein